MLLFTRRNDLTPYILLQKAAGKKVGFVPTMGALHSGHLSLVRVSKRETDLTVVSIFVNPSQFNNADDLLKYPRTTETDIEKLIAEGCDILYLPEPADIYPDGYSQNIQFDFAGLDTLWEGASRPGHFKGVVEVVEILLSIIHPDILFLGQKDYQQYLILNNLVKALKMNISVVMCPIVREENGLAMSSRNERLTPEIRKNARVIHATLEYAASLIGTTDISEIEKKCIALIDAVNHFKTDYFQVVNAETLQPVHSKNDAEHLVVLTAVMADGVRLLDNKIVQ